MNEIRVSKSCRTCKFMKGGQDRAVAWCMLQPDAPRVTRSWAVCSAWELEKGAPARDLRTLLKRAICPHVDTHLLLHKYEVVTSGVVPYISLLLRRTCKSCSKWLTGPEITNIYERRFKKGSKKILTEDYNPVYTRLSRNLTLLRGSMTEPWPLPTWVLREE